MLLCRNAKLYNPEEMSVYHDPGETTYEIAVGICQITVMYPEEGAEDQETIVGVNNITFDRDVIKQLRKEYGMNWDKERMLYHKTSQESGRIKIPIAGMSDTHLYNTIRMKCTELAATTVNICTMGEQQSPRGKLLYGEQNADPETYRELMASTISNIGPYVTEACLRGMGEMVRELLIAALGRNQMDLEAPGVPGRDRESERLLEAPQQSGGHYIKTQLPRPVEPTTVPPVNPAPIPVPPQQQPTVDTVVSNTEPVQEPAPQPE